eukprot:jgi/Tetstr1/443076/TSEL_031132.t1
MIMAYHGSFNIVAGGVSNLFAWAEAALDTLYRGKLLAIGKHHCVSPTATDQDSIEPPGKLRELIEEVAAWLRLPGAMGSWTVSSTLHPRYRRKQGPWRRLCSRQWPSCRQMCRIAREFTRGESACTLHRVAAARELGSRRITVGWKS